MSVGSTTSSQASELTWSNSPTTNGKLRRESLEKSLILDEFRHSIAKKLLGRLLGRTVSKEQIPNRVDFGFEMFRMFHELFRVCSESITLLFSVDLSGSIVPGNRDKPNRSPDVNVNMLDKWLHVR